jgi:hypothetical protein
MVTTIRTQWLPQSRNPASIGDDSRGNGRAGTESIASALRAVAKYLGPHYRQHNPGAADGPEPFIAFVKRFAQIYPDFRFESKRIIAEGNYVVLHFSNDLLSRRPNSGRF